MTAEARWLRYRRDSVLFATVWLLLGLGTLLVGDVDRSAAARATAWDRAVGPGPAVALLAGAAGTIWIVAASRGGSTGSRIALTLSLLGVLMPLQVFAVTYAVIAAQEATAGLLVISVTLAWPGVANLGAVLFTERRFGKR